MKNFKNYLIERKRDEIIPPWKPPIGGYDVKPDPLDRAPPPPQIDGPGGGRGEVWEPKGPIGRPGSTVNEPGRIRVPLRDIVKPNIPSPPPAGLDELPAPSWWVGTTASWRSYLLWLARTAPEALAQLLARIAPWFWNEQQAGAVGGHMYKDPNTGHWWYDTGEAGWVELDSDGRRIPLSTSPDNPVKANEPISLESVDNKKSFKSYLNEDQEIPAGWLPIPQDFPNDSGLWIAHQGVWYWVVKDANGNVTIHTNPHTGEPWGPTPGSRIWRSAFPNFRIKIRPSRDIYQGVTPWDWNQRDWYEYINSDFDHGQPYRPNPNIPMMKAED